MKHWYRVIIAGIVMLSVAGVGLACRTLGAGVIVTVYNAATGSITNVQIKYTGGTETFEKLESLKSLNTKVNPSGESHVDIEFTDFQGKKYSIAIDVYFERNYRGNLDITIEPDYKVTWKNNIKI